MVCINKVPGECLVGPCFLVAASTGMSIMMESRQSRWVLDGYSIPSCYFKSPGSAQVFRRVICPGRLRNKKAGMVIPAFSVALAAGYAAAGNSRKTSAA